jgi:hypothetical protein
MKLRSQIIILWVMGTLLVTFNSEANYARNDIFYAKERLTAHLVGAKLKEVLSSVAKEAKVEFSLNEAIATKKVSVRFDKLPLEEGIKRILRPFSYSMIFSPLGRLEKVIIFEHGSNSTSKPVSVGDHSELAKTISQEDYDFSLSPPGSAPESDEGLASKASVPWEETEEPPVMEGVDEDQQTSPEGDAEMEHASPEPPGEMPVQPGVKDQTSSAKSPQAP